VLDRITAETLIIWGEHDRVLHVEDAELLRQRIQNSRKVVLAGIGHVPMVEAPKQVASLCKQFYDAPSFTRRLDVSARGADGQCWLRE